MAMYARWVGLLLGWCSMRPQGGSCSMLGASLAGCRGGFEGPSCRGSTSEWGAQPAVCHVRRLRGVPEHLVPSTVEGLLQQLGLDVRTRKQLRTSAHAPATPHAQAPRHHHHHQQVPLPAAAAGGSGGGGGGGGQGGGAVGLTSADTACGGYSGGSRRKLALAVALVRTCVRACARAVAMWARRLYVCGRAGAGAMPAAVRRRKQAQGDGRAPTCPGLHQGPSLTLVLALAPGWRPVPGGPWDSTGSNGFCFRVQYKHGCPTWPHSGR